MFTIGYEGMVKMDDLLYFPQLKKRMPLPYDCTNLLVSIKQEGQIAPIHIYPNGIIAAGFRRYYVALFLGWQEIKAKVVPYDSENNVKILTLFANR